MIVRFGSHDALAIANWFLSRSANERRPMDLLRLQRLLYLAHAWHLHYQGEPLIKEDILAGPFGPVVDVVQREFVKFGSEPITQLAARLFTDPFQGPRWVPFEVPADHYVVHFLEVIWELYRDWSTDALVAFTSDEQSAWRKTISQNFGRPGGQISNLMILQEIKDRLNARRATPA